MQTRADKRLIVTLLAAWMLASCSAGGSAASAGAPQLQSAPAAAIQRSARSLPPGVFRMTRAQIMDPAGFEKPMLAATVLIPDGWSAQGSVVWGAHGQCGNDYSTRWEIASPDGASRLSMIPAAHWQGTRTNFPMDQRATCPEAFHTSVRAYLEATAQQMFPGGRILDYRSLDDELKAVHEMVARMPPPASAPGFQAQIHIEAGEVLVAFQENGREMRAALSATATISQMRMADMVNPGRIAMETVTGTPSGLLVVKAPNGALDLELRRRVLSSLRSDAEWARRIQEFNARKQAMAARASRQNLQASQAAHEARMQTLRETNDIMNGIYEDRQLASDRQQRERIEAIRGVETYHDPVAGGAVQLDNNYQHAWRVSNQADTYILTNDVNFNPGAYDIDAQQMKPLQ